MSYIVVQYIRFKTTTDWARMQNFRFAKSGTTSTLCSYKGLVWINWASSTFVISLLWDYKLPYVVNICSRSNMSNMRDSLSLGYWNSEKRVENTRHSWVLFLWNSRCLVKRWNTVSSVWYTVSSQLKHQGVNREVNLSKSRLILRPICKPFFLVFSFFVLTWWIINEFEKVRWKVFALLIFSFIFFYLVVWPRCTEKSLQH